MKARGSYKLTANPLARSRPGGCDDPIDGLLRGGRRAERILESLRTEIIEGGAGQSLRIRQVFENPRKIYRIELELPEMRYQRTTLIDRDALEDLLEIAEVRAIVAESL